MAVTVERLKEELLTLAPIERNDIIHFLIESLSVEDEDVDENWIAELRRREEEILDGTAEGIPAEEAFAELRKSRP